MIIFAGVKNLIGMKKITLYILLAVMLGCTTAHREATRNSEFVRVEDGKFMLGDSIYRFVGTNF